MKGFYEDVEYFGLVCGVILLLVFSYAQSYAQPAPPPTITIAPSAPVTIQPPVGLPTHVYPGANGGPATVVPPIGLPTFIYTR